MGRHGVCERLRDAFHLCYALAYTYSVRLPQTPLSEGFEGFSSADVIGQSVPDRLSGFLVDAFRFALDNPLS